MWENSSWWIQSLPSLDNQPPMSSFCPFAPNSSWTLRKEMGNPSQARETNLNRNKENQLQFEIKDYFRFTFWLIKPKELEVFRVNKMDLHFGVQCLLLSNPHLFLVVSLWTMQQKRPPLLQIWDLGQEDGRDLESSVCLEYGKWIIGSMYN